jgi:hypothetical protein
MSRKRMRPAARPGAETLDHALRKTHDNHNPSGTYLRAHVALYSSQDQRALLAAAGLSVKVYNAGRHWIITGRGLRIQYWPTRRKWRAFGRGWQSSAETVVRAIEKGRIRMPDEAQASSCKRCGTAVFWLKSARGKWIPLEPDGDSHISRCKAEDGK